MKTSTKMWIAYYMGLTQTLIIWVLDELKAPVWVFVVTLGIVLLIETFIFCKTVRK